jgi:hypothetical protein
MLKYFICTFKPVLKYLKAAVGKVHVIFPLHEKQKPKRRDRSKVGGIGHLEIQSFQAWIPATISCPTFKHVRPKPGYIYIITTQ